MDVVFSGFDPFSPDMWIIYTLFIEILTLFEQDIRKKITKNQPNFFQWKKNQLKGKKKRFFGQNH